MSDGKLIVACRVARPWAINRQHWENTSRRRGHLFCYATATSTKYYAHSHAVSRDLTSVHPARLGIWLSGWPAPWLAPSAWPAVGLCSNFAVSGRSAETAAVVSGALRRALVRPPRRDHIGPCEFGRREHQGAVAVQVQVGCQRKRCPGYTAGQVCRQEVYAFGT